MLLWPLTGCYDWLNREIPNWGQMKRSEMSNYKCLCVNRNLWQLSKLTLSLSNAVLLQLREEAKEKVQQILSNYAAESELLNVGLHSARCKTSGTSCVDHAIYVQ